MPTEPVTTGFEIWKQFGYPGLFVFCFLALSVLFVLTVRMFLKKIEDMQKNTITCIMDAATAQRDVVETLEAVKKSLDENCKQSAEALAYIRARDSFFGGRGK